MLDLVECLSYSVLLVHKSNPCGRFFVDARVAELADALDLGSSG
jgi:hypothetical protein